MARTCRGGRGDVYGQFAELPLESLLVLAVAGAASRVGDGRATAMAKVFSHLRLERTLHRLLGEPLEQPILTNQVLRVLVIGQQAAQQFVAYGHYSSFL